MLFADCVYVHHNLYKLTRIHHCLILKTIYTKLAGRPFVLRPAEDFMHTKELKKSHCEASPHIDEKTDWQ